MVPSSRGLGTRDGKESSSVLGAHALIRLSVRFEPLEGELIGDSPTISAAPSSTLPNQMFGSRPVC